MSDADKEFDFDGVLDDADIEYCEHGVNVVCVECRARISTLEARIAELTAEIEQVRRELGDWATIAATASADLKRVTMVGDRIRNLLRFRVESSCLNCRSRADECCPYCGSVPATKIAAARAERDEAVGLLRDCIWWQEDNLRHVKCPDDCPYARASAYLARVAAAPEKETTTPWPYSGT